MSYGHWNVTHGAELNQMQFKIFHGCERLHSYRKSIMLSFLHRLESSYFKSFWMPATVSSHDLLSPSGGQIIRVIAGITNKNRFSKFSNIRHENSLGL